MENETDNNLCEKTTPKARRILIVLAAAVLTVLAISAFVTILVKNVKKSDDEVVDLNNPQLTIDLLYATFEEYVSNAEVILRGRYTGEKRSKPVFDVYTFKVISVIYGEVFTKKIDLKVMRNATVNLGYSPTDITYEKGKDYYLVLSDVSGPYYDKDTMSLVGGNIFLPSDDIGACTMYGDPLPDHSLIEESGTVHSIEEYLRALIDQGLLDKDGKRKNQYIRSSDFNTVIRNSDFILHVRFNEKTMDSIDNSRSSYLCTVISSLKGDVEPGKTVEIIVPYGTLDTGDEVVLALFDIAPKSEAEPRNYKLSSPKSVFKVSQKGKIEKALKK